MGSRRGPGAPFQRASDGAWLVQLSIGGRGNRRYLTKSFGQRKPTLREARDEYKRLQERAGLVAGVSKMTTGAYLERWVNDARDIRPTTRHGYRAVVTYHLVPSIGDVLLVDLSPLHVEGMLTKLAPTMKPKTLRNVHVVLRRALGQAVRAGYISKNVAGREFVDAPKVPDAEPRALTHDEETALRAVESPIARHVLVSLGTGLRQGELLGLAWEDIEPTRLHVRQELVYRSAKDIAREEGRELPPGRRHKGKYRREEPKTPRSKRTIPLNDEVAAAFEAQRQALIADGFVPTKTGPVFVNRDGKALNGSWLTHAFYDLCTAAKIERQPWKVLRATFSSRLHEAGVDSRTIADLMGHTRERTTQRHYVTSSPELAVAAVARLGQDRKEVTG